MNKKINNTSILFAYVGIAPLIGSFLVFSGSFLNESIFELIQHSPLITFLLLTILLSVSFLPTTFSAILCGVFFGWKGLLIIVPAYLIASTGIFWLSKKFDGNELILALSKKEKVKVLLEGISKQSNKFIIYARLSPVLPFAIMNVCFSILGIKFKKFIIAGTIGMLPRTVLSVWAGIEMNNIYTLLENGNKPSGYQLIVLSLFLVSTIGMISLIYKTSKGPNQGTN